MVDKRPTQVVALDSTVMVRDPMAAPEVLPMLTALLEDTQAVAMAAEVVPQMDVAMVPAVAAATLVVPAAKVMVAPVVAVVLLLLQQ
jgi:hypothetical protein